jgi:hypothetical protein
MNDENGNGQVFWLDDSSKPLPMEIPTVVFD